MSQESILPNEYPGEVVLRGKPFRPTEDHIFEKRSTGSAGEALDVLGGIAGQGTGGNNYVRLWEAGDVVRGVFVDQTTHRPFLAGEFRFMYCEDGYPCNIVEGGTFLFLSRLTTSQTIVVGDSLEPVTKTPFVQKKSAGPTVARAAEAKVTTGEIAWIKAWSLINNT
jgi:hypothetical protein